MAESTAATITRGIKAILERAARNVDRNALDEAERELSEVFAREIDQPQALHLLGVVRRTQGRHAEAETLYRRSLSADPGQPVAHHNLGLLMTSLGRLEEAAAAFREAIRLKPNYAEAHLNLALILSDQGDHEGAEKSCRNALRYQPNYLVAQQALSTELCALGRPKEAEQLLRRTLATGMRNPRQAAALEHNLAMALKQQDRLEEALAHFDAAQTSAPDMPAVDFNRAGTLQQLGRTEESAKAYARAVARDPTHVESLANYALMSALTANFGIARSAGERAIAAEADQPIALVALAIAGIESGAFDEANEKLARVVALPAFASNRQASFALGFAADAFERKGEYSRAFAFYKISNTAKRMQQTSLESVRAIGDVERLKAYFSNCAPWPASAAPPTSEARGHVFVLGFMRSGTTLLETILATNPGVVGIDEIEFLTPFAREFLLDERGLSKLAALDANQAALRRAAYWKSVRDAGISVAGKIFIDKMPFNSLRLPLIARLFPDATVIFAIRDPRDVVISCFRRRFNPTPFAYEFLDLEDCARFYAASMALTEKYREKLPLRMLDHRYEDMIGDFDFSLRSVCDFVGLDYAPSMREFAGAAQEIDRRSASAAQVRRGLYGEGVAQWRRYRHELEPVLPILEPWVARFGYSQE